MRTMRNGRTPYDLPVIREELLGSRLVDQTFRMKVFVPLRKADGSERFPVVYATDSDKIFGGLAALASELQLAGQVSRFVLVGIGYENANAVDMLRMRDLFPRSVRDRVRPVIEQLAQSPFGAGITDLRAITEGTDAEQFLHFVREELMPWTNGRYPVKPEEASYFGFSAGGTFGLYTLFTQPEMFKRYILASPGTSYNGYHFGIEMMRTWLAPGRPVNASVFMSVGELEEFYAHFDLTTGYYKMAKALRDAAIPGLSLTCKLFPQETHATAWALAFAHGVNAMFCATQEASFRPDFSVQS
jgi:uncharacterized protein